MAISNIINGELFSSIRTKLNALIDRMNGDSSHYNHFIGDQAGDNNDYSGGGVEGQFNTFHGALTGKENTKGAFNTHEGARAGELCDEGSYNSSYGAFALRELINALNTSAFGAYCLSAGKYAERMSGFGASALEKFVNGSYGAAFAYNSQYENRVGVRNSSFGYKTLQLNKFAFDNTVGGYKAAELLNPTCGLITSYADAGGGQVTVTSAGHGLSNGTTIVIRGTGPWVDHAFASNYDGQYTISGVTTDTFEITASYIAEASLNYLGVWGIETEARNNTAVGFSAGSLLEKGSNNILIGYGVQAADEDGDYQLNIGDLITGDMAIGQKFAKIDGFMKLEPQASAPATPSEGWIYANSTDHHLYFYNGTDWVQIDN